MSVTMQTETDKSKENFKMVAYWNVKQMGLSLPRQTVNKS